MTNDIQPLGATPGRGWFWIKEHAQFGQSALRLISIDDAGEIATTVVMTDYDEAARTKGEALAAHLTDGIAEADRDLEQRRKDAPEPKPKPDVPDEATRRFMGMGA